MRAGPQHARDTPWRSAARCVGRGGEPGEPYERKDGWRPLRVRWHDEPLTAAGWWRVEPGWVMAVAVSRLRKCRASSCARR